MRSREFHDDVFLSSRQIAEHFFGGVDRERHVRGLYERHGLSTHRIGSNRLIRVGDLREFLEDHRQAGAF